MKTILVGPTGFLGENFLRLRPDLISVGRRKPRNSGIKHINISSEFNFEVLDDLTFDYAIFLIGSSDHEVLRNNPSKAFEMNVIPLAKFFDYLASRENKPKKVITFTTMLQYDTKKMNIPCNELQPIKPDTSNYVLSKVTAENLSKLYRKYFQIIDIRLSNVYGPTHLRRPDLIPTLMHNILDKKQINVWTKEPIRDFVFVNDVVEVVMNLLNVNFSGPLNVGSGMPTKVKEICDFLEKQCAVIINSQNNKVSGHMKYVHDLSLLKSLINYKPSSINKGLSETYNYMKNVSRNSF